MNCFVAITCVLALTASTKADGLGAGLVYAPGHASVDYYAYPRYAFEYAVKDPHTGDNKAQWEKREGDVVKGAYSLVEPDGSLRVVEYWADDKSGFNAVVKRLGPNVHPVAAPVAPIYKAPIPVLESHGPIAPISIGPIAKYSGLASAPLISGPLLGGGAISSASIYRPPVVSVAKEVTPILPAIESAPILSSPILSAPVYKAPIVSAPLAAPIYKALPAPVIAAPYDLGHGGLGHLDGVGLGGGYLGGLGHYGAGLVKAPHAGPGYLEELGHGLLNKGLGLGAYGGYQH